MRSLIIVLLFIGILLRILLASTTFHSDIQHFDFAGFVISKGNLLNFYDFVPKLEEEDLIVKIYPRDVFNYPPLVYFTLGSFAAFFKNIISEDIWLKFLFESSSVLGDFQLKIHLLSLKLPYLIFDILAAFLLMRFFKEKRNQILAFSLWFFNPINLYATYMIGQFDIIPTFFVILALFILKREMKEENKLILAALLLGIGAAFKIYPFFLLIPLASLSSSWMMRAKILIVGICPYILVMLPFLFSSGFRSSALVANQSLKSLYPQIPVSGGESIFLFLLFLVFFYLVFLQRRIEKSEVWKRFLLALSLFFIFTHFHPQWLLWLSPFLVISLIKENFRTLLPITCMFCCWFLSIFFFDPGLSTKLFAPIWPNLQEAKSIWDIFSLNLDYNFSRSILQTIFAGSLLYLVYYYFSERSFNQQDSN